jgi:hypothetical protein
MLKLKGLKGHALSTPCSADSGARRCSDTVRGSEALGTLAENPLERGASAATVAHVGGDPAPAARSTPAG